MRDTHLWSVWAGDNGETESVDLASSTTSVYWDEIPDFRTFNTLQELEAAHANVYPGWPRGHVITAATSMWTFYQDIQPGDVIIMPMRGLNADSQRTYTVGRVKPEWAGGGYTYQPSRPGCHNRGVDWIYGRLPEHEFLEAGIDANHLFRRPSTVNPIYPIGAEEVIAVCKKLRPIA